ncbi:Copper transport outer membrane protein, MctB [Jatrophihabitans endophyticus]|uniref:Copper transport outer membrane protein, MctB n=1 Tax=Jatrophihabitans endophyticus TaxID=1206085 RepID=A0A1M5MPU0_9ACTN|nr:copper transporter [Jatrophihabitans endophyticus]SHG79256.1 Copper transport outer membrane protein, MctB [Jatrophihabitans endophyticus]
MISFRYHIVSIVAVFLALALGIVVGATALNGPITKDLRNQVDDVKSQRDDLADQVKKLQGQVDDAGEFATTYGSQLVAKTLTGRSVLVVSLPGTTPGMQDGVTEQIGAAGGKVSGQLTVTKAYLDASRGSEINTLATGPAHPIAWTAPETDDTGKLGASLLAYVLLGKGQPTDVKQVVSAFAERHLVSVAGSDIAPSTTVVVLGRGKLKSDSYAARSQLALVDALVAGGGKVVVAGDDTSAADGGVIGTVRKQSTDRDSVSTVDDANSSLGQVSTTLALAAAVKGQAGHYGTQDGADALFPTPAR